VLRQIFFDNVGIAVPVAILVGQLIMLFSEHYAIKKTDGDDWFDPILFTDTPLFIDPFLNLRCGKRPL
jgi:hypothetical protein